MPWFGPPGINDLQYAYPTLAQLQAGLATNDPPAWTPIAPTAVFTTGGWRPEVIRNLAGDANDDGAFDARDLAGTVVLVGVPNPSMVLEIPLIEVFGHGGATKSSWYGDCLPSRDFPMLVDLHLQGRLPLEKFVSETIRLDAVEEAFHKMHKGEVLRSVVVF